MHLRPSNRVISFFCPNSPWIIAQIVLVRSYTINSKFWNRGRPNIVPRRHPTRKFGEITQNKGHYTVLVHSITNWKLTYDFLLVINTNLLAILDRFRDLAFNTSKIANFGNLTAYRAVFSHIFTAHAQERAFMNFWLKFWHHHSIPWSRFPYRARYFGDTRTFSVDFFALDKLNVCHTSGLVDLLIEKVSHVMCTSSLQFPPSLKLIRPSVA